MTHVGGLDIKALDIYSLLNLKISGADPTVSDDP